MRDGIRVVHVPAGPPHVIAPDLLLPYMGEFARWLEKHWREGDWTPEVAHAHFWTSGLAAVTAARQRRHPRRAVVPRARRDRDGRRQAVARRLRAGAGPGGGPGGRAEPGRGTRPGAHRRAAYPAHGRAGRGRQRAVHPGRAGRRTRPGASPHPVGRPVGRAQGLRRRHPGHAVRARRRGRRGRRPARRPAAQGPGRHARCARWPNGCTWPTGSAWSARCPPATSHAGTARPTCSSPRPG